MKPLKVKVSISLDEDIVEEIKELAEQEKLAESSRGENRMTAHSANTSTLCSSSILPQEKLKQPGNRR